MWRKKDEVKEGGDGICMALPSRSDPDGSRFAVGETPV